jgi:hypothetical protein
MTDKKDAGNSKTPAEPWHAVAIVTREGSCPAAMACREKRYLSAEAPRLPMQGCVHPQALYLSPFRRSTR